KDESSEWDERERRQSDEGRSERTRVVSEFSIKNQNRETQKRIRLERTQSNGQGFKPGTQERNTAFSIFLLPLPFLSSAALQNSGEFATPQNTIYETNNTS